MSTRSPRGLCGACAPTSRGRASVAALDVALDAPVLEPDLGTLGALVHDRDALALEDDHVAALVLGLDGAVVGAAERPDPGDVQQKRERGDAGDGERSGERGAPRAARRG